MIPARAASATQPGPPRAAGTNGFRGGFLRFAYGEGMERAAWPGVNVRTPPGLWDWNTWRSGAPMARILTPARLCRHGALAP